MLSIEEHETIESVLELINYVPPEDHTKMHRREVATYNRKFLNLDMVLLLPGSNMHGVFNYVEYSRFPTSKEQMTIRKGSREFYFYTPVGWQFTGQDRFFEIQPIICATGWYLFRGLIIKNEAGQVCVLNCPCVIDCYNTIPKCKNFPILPGCNFEDLNVRSIENNPPGDRIKFGSTPCVWCDTCMRKNGK